MIFAKKHLQTIKILKMMYGTSKQIETEMGARNRDADKKGNAFFLRLGNHL